MKRSLLIPLIAVAALSCSLLLSPNFSLDKNEQDTSSGSTLEDVGQKVFHSIVADDYAEVQQILLTPSCTGEGAKGIRETKVVKPKFMRTEPSCICPSEEDLLRGENDPLRQICRAAQDTLSQCRQIRAMHFDWANAHIRKTEYYPVSNGDIKGAYVLLTADSLSGEQIQIRLKCIETSCGWMLAGIDTEV